MKYLEIHTSAPATVANVACGFDIFGFAVDGPCDEVVIRRSSNSGVTIKNIYGDRGRLSLDPEKNTAGVAVLSFLKHLGIEQGVELDLYKHLPLGSGLGSSSASAVAAVLAANALFGEPLTRQQLLPFTLEAERMACGSAHADNVAPCLLGGFVLIRSYSPLDVIPVSVPDDLHCVVVSPEIELRTEDARRILRNELPMKNAITQWGNTAALVVGLLQSDFDLISRSLEDVVVEPERSVLIPGFAQLKQNVLNAGALGCSISGSGPSVFAFTKGNLLANDIAAVMKKAFLSIGIESKTYISPINKTGARILSKVELKNESFKINV